MTLAVSRTSGPAPLYVHADGACPAGEAAKYRGIQMALKFAGDGWADRILDEFAIWLTAKRLGGFKWIVIEEFRSQARNQPAGNAAWGGLPRLAVRAGLIAPYWVAKGIQGRVKAASPKTHCHEVRQWRPL